LVTPAAPRAYSASRTGAAIGVRPPREYAMSKGLDSKKSDKKKPAKTMKEKKQAKKEKKAGR